MVEISFLWVEFSAASFSVFPPVSVLAYILNFFNTSVNLFSSTYFWKIELILPPGKMKLFTGSQLAQWTGKFSHFTRNFQPDLYL